MESVIRGLGRPSRRQILGVGASAAAAVSTVGLSGCSEQTRPATFVLVHGAPSVAIKNPVT